MDIEIIPSIYNYESKTLHSAEKSNISCKIDDLLFKIIKKERFNKYHLKEQNIYTHGGNYLGILHEVDVVGEDDDGKKELNLFVKRALPVDQLEFLSITDVFKRELFFYKEISKMYKNLENVANIPKDQRFRTCRSFEESNTEAIILENVSRKGFTTLHRTDVIPLKFAQLSLQQLGKFHALSFALEKKQPEYLKKKVMLLNCPISCNDNWKKFLEQIVVIAASLLDESRGHRLLKFKDKMFSKYVELMSIDPASKNVLCHGDFRANNILMKSVNGAINEVIPVDYQLMYYGSPVHDFLYFIFSATDKQFRDMHLDSLKDLYYKSLADHLELLGINPEDVYPKELFNNDYKKRLEFGLINMIMLSPFLFASENDVPDLSKESITVTIKICTDDKYKERVWGIVDEFIGWGYL